MYALFGLWQQEERPGQVLWGHFEPDLALEDLAQEMSRPWTRSLTPLDGGGIGVGVSNRNEVGQEVPARPSHKHAGGEGLQLDGLDAQQEKIEHVGRECDDGALLERQQ